MRGCGVDADIIDVEVDVSGVKMQEDHRVDLPDAAVRESRDRVRSALKNLGYDTSPTEITNNLGPVLRRKVQGLT